MLDQFPNTKRGLCLEPYLGYELAHNAEKIYHVSGLPNKILQLGVAFGTPNEVQNNLLRARAVWQRLSDYDIFVPTHSAAIGTDISDRPLSSLQTTYILRDEIKGDSIAYITDFQSIEPKFDSKITGFIGRLTDFYIDSYFQGNDFPFDIPHIYQFVYGNTQGDSEKRIYYVDTEPYIEYADQEYRKTGGNESLFACLGDIYFHMIPWLEKNTGQVMEQAKREFHDKIKTMPFPSWRSGVLKDLRRLKKAAEPINNRLYLL